MPTIGDDSFHARNGGRIVRNQALEDDLGILLNFRLSCNRGDPHYRALARTLRPSESRNKGLSRIIHRYLQHIEEAIRDRPPIQIIRMLHMVLATHMHVFDTLGYPSKAQVIILVKHSTLTEDKRQDIVSWIDHASFAQFASLIESVEAMVFQEIITEND